jgi:hypothetical protein
VTEKNSTAANELFLPGFCFIYLGVIWTEDKEVKKSLKLSQFFTTPIQKRFRLDSDAIVGLMKEKIKNLG